MILIYLHQYIDMKVHNHNKGYTLVEILVVLMLISIIIVLVSTNVGNHLSNAKELEYNNKLNLIVNAGIKYGEERINYIQDETSKNNFINIKISDLNYNGKLVYYDDCYTNLNKRTKFCSELFLSKNSILVGKVSKKHLHFSDKYYFWSKIKETIQKY